VQGGVVGKMSEEEINTIIQEADADGDGEIDFEEFCTMMVGKK
jgi:Ca2+-binding EF-hand superfamily protein